MPYSSDNWELAETILFSSFIPVKSLSSLRKALLATNFSVVDSRRDCMVALNTWLESGITLLEDKAERLPNQWGDAWNDMSDELTIKYLSAIQNTLSDRDSNVAKDVSEGNNDKKGKGTETIVMGEQGSQDRIKRFEEVRTLLLKHLAGAGSYTCTKLERKYHLTWTAAP